MSGPRTLYAIGDVHGQLRQLQALHAQVLDHFRTEGDGRALLIHLGDLIDR
ncbi:MAG: metallophosphoesterase, partial [Hyphomonadaceae bacterium]|nr:metallophosphoesterase [Hyphomonadaceae bacterium]